MTRLTKASALALTVLPLLASSLQYQLIKEYNSTNLFDEFNFLDGSDPTGGFVRYVPYDVAAASQLISNATDIAYIGVDTSNVYTAGELGRPSVRLGSKATYTQGLFVVDLIHLPVGCGTWPAFWTTDLDNWPAHGEIDIIEGVNDARNNNAALHTLNQCDVTETTNQTGIWKSTECSSVHDQNQGCSAGFVEPNSYGSDFNRNGGGVYAMEWTSDAIRIWFFPPTGVPTGLTDGGIPDTASFGVPSASFSGPCSSSFGTAFVNHSIVIDTTFCGGWAGNAYGSGSSSCPLAPGMDSMQSCVDYVANNPMAFQEAYWGIRSVKVWQEAPSLPPSGLATPSTESILDSVIPSAAVQFDAPQVPEPSNISPLTGGILIDESQKVGPVKLPHINTLIAVPSTLLTAASAFGSSSLNSFLDIIPSPSNSLDDPPKIPIPLPTTQTVVDDVSIAANIPEIPLPIVDEPIATNPFVNALGTNPFNMAANALGTGFGAKQLSDAIASNAPKNGFSYSPPYGNRRFWSPNSQGSLLLADDSLNLQYLSDSSKEAELIRQKSTGLLNTQFPPLARSPQAQPPTSGPVQASPIANTNNDSPVPDANAAAPIEVAIPTPVAQAEAVSPAANPDLSASIAVVDTPAPLAIASLPATVADASPVVPISSANPAPAIVNANPAPAIVSPNPVAPVASLNIYPPSDSTVPVPPNNDVALDTFCSAGPNLVDKILSIANNLPSPLPKASSVVALDPPNGPGAALVAAAPTPLNVPIVPSLAAPAVDIASQPVVPAVVPIPPVSPVVPLLNLTVPPKKGGSLLKFLDTKTKDTLTSVLAPDAANSTDSSAVKRHQMELAAPADESDPVGISGAGQESLRGAPESTSAVLGDSEDIPAPKAAATPDIPADVSISSATQNSTNEIPLVSDAAQGYVAPISPVVQDFNPIAIQAATPVSNAPIPAVVPGTPALVSSVVPDVPSQLPAAVLHPSFVPVPGVAQNYPAPILPAVQDSAIPDQAVSQGIVSGGPAASSSGSISPQDIQSLLSLFGLPKPPSIPVANAIPPASNNLPQMSNVSPQLPDTIPQVANVLTQVPNAPKAPAVVVLPQTANANPVLSLEPVVPVTALNSTDTKVAMAGLLSFLDDDTKAQLVDSLVPEDDSTGTARQGNVPNADLPVDGPLTDPLEDGLYPPQLEQTVPAPQATELVTPQGGNPVNGLVMDPLGGGINPPQLDHRFGTVPAPQATELVAPQGGNPVADPLIDPLEDGIDPLQFGHPAVTVSAPQATELVAPQGGNPVDGPLIDPLGGGIDHPQLDDFAGSAPTSRETWGDESAFLSDVTKAKLDEIISEVAGLNVAGIAGLPGGLNDSLASGEILRLRDAINTLDKNDKTELGKFLTGDDNIEDASNSLDGLFLQGLISESSLYAGTMLKIVGAAKSFAEMPNEGTRSAFWDTVKDGVSSVYAETHPSSDPSRVISAHENSGTTAVGSPWTFLDKVALAQNIYGLCPTPYFAGIYFPSSTSLAFDLLDPKQTLEAALSTYQRRLQAYYQVAVQGCWTRINQWLAWRQLVTRPGAINVVAFPQAPLPLLKRQASDDDDGSADPKGLVEQQIYTICPKPDTFSADSLIVDLEDPNTTLEVAIGKFQNKVWAYMAKLQSCSDQIRNIGPKLKDLVDETPAPEPIFHTNGAVNVPGAVDASVDVSKPSDVPEPASRQQVQSLGDIPAEAILEPLALQATGLHFKDLPIDQQDNLWNALIAGLHDQLPNVADTATKAVSSIAPKASSLTPKPSSIIGLSPFDPVLYPLDPLFSKRTPHAKRQIHSSSSITNSPLDNGIIPDKDTPEGLDEILGKHGTLDPFGMLVDDDSTSDDGPHYNDHSRPFQGDDAYTWDLPSSSVDKADPDVDEIVDKLGELDPFGQLGPRVKPAKGGKSDPEDEKDKVLDKLHSNAYFGKLRGYECGGKGRKYNAGDVRDDEEDFIDKYYHGSARHHKNRYWRERQHGA